MLGDSGVTAKDLGAINHTPSPGPLERSQEPWRQLSHTQGGSRATCRERQGGGSHPQNEPPTADRGAEGTQEPQRHPQPSLGEGKGSERTIIDGEVVGGQGTEPRQTEPEPTPLPAPAASSPQGQPAGWSRAAATTQSQPRGACPHRHAPRQTVQPSSQTAQLSTAAREPRRGSQQSNTVETGGSGRKVRGEVGHRQQRWATPGSPASPWQQRWPPRHGTACACHSETPGEGSGA